MSDFAKRVASIFLQDEQPKKSLKELTAEAKKLYNELAKLPRGTDAFNAKSKQFQAVKGDLTKLRGEINGTNSVFGNMAKSLGPLAGLMGVTFGGAAILGGIRKSREEWLHHEKAVNAVTIALQNNGKASGQTVSGLVNAADDLELNSLFSAEDILTGVTTKLLTFGNIAGEQFDRAQQAAVDWAATTGGDVSGAAQALGIALSNPEKGLTKLTRAGIIFSDEQKSVIQGLMDTGKAAEAQAIILAEFEKKFAGQAAAQAANEKGVRALDQAFGDIVEGGGGFFNAMIEDISGALAPMLRGLGDWLGVTNKQSVELGMQRVEMNALFNVLKTGNHTAEEQAELVGRINKEYKDFLPTQISVTSSTEELEAAQRGANKAMLERIMLLAKQEILEEAQREAVEAQKEALEAEITFQRAQQDGLTGWEKLKAGIMQGGTANQYYANQLVVSKTNAIEASKAYEEMVGVLGSVADAQQAVQDAAGSGEGGAVGPSPEELEEATKRGEEIRKTIKDAQRDIEIDRLEGAERERRIITDKYRQMAEDAAGSGITIEEIEAAQQVELNAVREKYGKKELERLRKLDADIRKITDEHRVARVAAENKAEVEAINERYRTAREQVAGNNEAIAALDREQRAELITVGEQQRAELQAATDEAELASIREKYAKLQEEAHGNKDRLLQIDALLAFELEAKRDEHADAAQQRAVDRQAAMDAIEADIRTRRMEQVDNELSAMEERHANELELAEQRGTDLTDLLQRQWEEKQELVAEQRQAEIDAVNEAFEEQYANEALTLEQSAELQRLHGEAISLLKRQHADADVQLQRETDQKILEGRKARRDAEIAVLNTVVSATRDLFVAAGSDAGEMAEFDKLMTLFQIGLDTASAISSLTAMSEANPFNAVTGGAAGVGQFIAGFARITANVAKASMLLSKPAPEPPGFYIGGGTGNYISTSTAPNVSTGGTVGNKTLGWFGERGPEWVAPNWMFSHPTLTPVFEHLEEMRTSGTVRPAFADGGATSTTASAPTGSGSTGAESSATLMMLAASINSLNAQLAQGTLARVSNDQLEDNNERLGTIRTEAQIRN